MMTLRWLVMATLASAPAILAENTATFTSYADALPYLAREAANRARVDIRVPNHKRIKGRLTSASDAEVVVSGHGPIPVCEISAVRLRRSRLRLTRRFAGAVAGGASGFVVGSIAGILQPHRGMLKEIFIQNPRMGATVLSELTAGSPERPLQFSDSMSSSLCSTSERRILPAR